MKKLLVLLVFTVCLSYSSSAALYMWCVDGIATYYNIDGNGTVTSWPAGGCAGGNWFVQLACIIHLPSGGQTGDSKVSGVINAHPPQGDGTVITKIPDDLQKIINDGITALYPDPSVLSQDLYTFIDKHP